MSAQTKNMGASVLRIINDFASDKPTSVPCGDCRACCTGYDVTPLPGDPDPSLFTDSTPDGTPRLPQLPGKVCAYLSEGRCSVYERRPLACQQYDCRTMAIARSFFRNRDDLNEVVDSWDVVGGIRTDKDLRIATRVNAAARALMKFNPGDSVESCVATATKVYNDKELDDCEVIISGPEYLRLMRAIKHAGGFRGLNSHLSRTFLAPQNTPETLMDRLSSLISLISHPVREISAQRGNK